MATKSMFQAMRKEGYITKPLDRYLFEKANEPNDRAINVNAPSQAGKCNRANYYMRTQVKGDGGIDPRTQRIFDNGHFTHDRLQGYLLEMNLLICDEVPLINKEYNIQGHTDGFIEISDTEIGILEIKSINDNGFNRLKGAREDHTQQGLIYLFCAEERRLHLRSTYKTLEDFYNSEPERVKYFESCYQHMKTGKKYTREEKIANEVRLNLIADDVLYFTEEPLKKVIFLYENKNTQELKEFTVERNKSTEGILKEVLADYKYLNECVNDGIVPERGGTGKSSNVCRWCSYQNSCFIV